MQPNLLAKITTLEQHNLQAAAEIESLKEVNLSLSFLSVMLILFDVQEVQKPVSTVVTALLDKTAKLEQQARKDQILAFFLSKMQFFASSGPHSGAGDKVYRIYERCSYLPKNEVYCSFLGSGILNL